MTCHLILLFISSVVFTSERTLGGGGARGHVLDRACSLALLTNSAAAGADGLRAAGDQRGGSEEGGPLQRGGRAATAGAVVLADAGGVLQ